MRYMFCLWYLVLFIRSASFVLGNLLGALVLLEHIRNDLFLGAATASYFRRQRRFGLFATRGKSRISCSACAKLRKGSQNA